MILIKTKSGKRSYEIFGDMQKDGTRNCKVETIFLEEKEREETIRIFGNIKKICVNSLGGADSAQ